MSSLFLKIFLWFWLTVVLVGLTLVVTALIMRSHSQTEAEEWKASVSFVVAGEANHAASIYEREGIAALRKHFELIQKIRFIYLYVLDERGNEVLNQKPPQLAVDLALEAGKDTAFLPSYRGADRFAAQRVVGPSGREYTFFLIAPGVPIRNLLRAMGVEAFLSLAGVLLVAGFFCFGLARHITTSVVQLGEAASQIAEGRLSTRVPESVHTRRDEIGLLGRHFDRMAERIESVVAGQQRLLSMVSHELRSPLTRLSLAVGLLRRCPPEETVEYLDRIESETEQLDKLIAQLLTLSRIESGANAGLSKEEIDLAGLIQEIAADGNFEARARSCIVCVGALESCITTGIADQLHRAIENVVRNAIRYTKAHSQVEITMRRAGEWPVRTAVIQVHDYGPGVPDTDLTKIFLPFYRVSSADGSTSNGTGLGLAITERIVRMHRGNIRAVNVPDGGLIVELTLPLKA